MATKGFKQLSTATKAYVTGVICAGALTVAHSFHALATHDTPWDWTLLALLTLVSGSATVKLPGLPATFSVSETFVFTSVLLFGVPAGTITVALDALVICVWSYRRDDPLYKIFFNLFALPLTIWTAAQIFFSLPDWPPLLSRIEPLYQAPTPVPIGRLLGPLVLLAATYFALNSWLIAFAIALERKLSPIRIWRTNFALLSLNYFGGASVAALLVTYTRNIQWEYIALIAPLLIALYFTFSHSTGRVADANRHLSELNTLYMSTIETLAMAIDAKDQITHGHIRRVQTYAVGLARKMGVSDESLIRAIEAAALLHDMGKLAVPEYILNKPGPLTPAEFERMKLHASIGADILSAINFPYPVVPMVRHHHENWDGSGYPDGLASTAIPIGARILSVVDCFDALTSDRPYRPRLSDNDALEILLSRRGTMYDPLVVDTFIRVHHDIAPESLPAPAIETLRAITDASIHHVPGNEIPSRPLDEIAASSEEMLTLFHLARGFNHQMSIQDAGDLIAKHLRRLVPCSLAVFFMYRIEHNDLVVAHAVGDEPTLISGLTVSLGERLSGWVAANRRAIRNSDPVLDLGEFARTIQPRLRSCLSVPLLADSQLIGVLSLYSPIRDAFKEEHQRVLEVASSQISAVLRQAVQFERNRELSLLDRVTGLPNLEELRHFTKSDSVAHFAGQPTSVILVRVPDATTLRPGFSLEAILPVVVRAIRRSLRAGDLLFRFDASAFVVLLLQTANETNQSIAGRVQEAITTDSKAVRLPQFDVTITTASSPTDGDTIEALISQASQRMLTREPDAGSRNRGHDSIH
jgi:diguanylate cyclase (GGDEF)-like protein/putative nucleotidyltransferase with HDIG domain